MSRNHTPVPWDVASGTETTTRSIMPIHTTDEAAPHHDHHGNGKTHIHSPGSPSTEPNKWYKIRQIFREPMAEFAGTMVLCIFGTSVNCQVVLSSNPSVVASPKGDWLSLAFGWAVGVSLGVWVSGGISGGHINPAVTLALATFRDFPWRKVPAYIFAQLMGGICGAGISYANYIHAIDIVEGGRNVRTLKTGGLFGTYAASYMTNVSAFFNEFLGTAMLMIVILAMTDKRNTPPPAGLAPLVLFIAILGIGIALGMQTGYAINPARDLGPRILTSMVGYGKQVYNFRSQYWLWCTVLGPISGALIGALMYDLFLFNGEESVINLPSRRRRAKAEESKV